MAQTLSLSARPRTLDALIGQDKLVVRVRNMISSGRIPKAWLLLGATGTGKTTTARILGVSLQCTHQEKFGMPCAACAAAYSGYLRRGIGTLDIMEINGAKVRGIREVEAALEGVDFAPIQGRYRVYVLDEFHKATDDAQNLMLKYLEDCIDTTIFILCSTAPQKIIETIQTRCCTLKLRELEIDDITLLVARLLKKVKSDLPVDRLADALVEKGITYPRLIANAVEKYVAGAEPEEAAEVQASEPINVEAVGRAIVKGDWAAAAKFLDRVQAVDARVLRASLLSYFRKILLCEPETDDRANATAQAIVSLCAMSGVEDSVMSAGISAVLFQAAKSFSSYKH